MISIDQGTPRALRIMGPIANKKQAIGTLATGTYILHRFLRNRADGIRRLRKVTSVQTSIKLALKAELAQRGIPLLSAVKQRRNRRASQRTRHKVPRVLSQKKQLTLPCGKDGKFFFPDDASLLNVLNEVLRQARLLDGLKEVLKAASKDCTTGQAC